MSQFPDPNCTNSGVGNVHRIIEPFLDFNPGTEETGSTFAKQKLVGMTSVGNGIIIADGAVGFRAEHGVQVDSFRDSTERRL